MMTLTFDKGMETERTLEVQSMYEYPIQKRLTANNEIEIQKSGDIPDISDFLSNPDFTTLEIKDGSVVIPTQTEYNHIADLSINYRAESKLYSVNIVLESLV